MKVFIEESFQFKGELEKAFYFYSHKLNLHKHGNAFGVNEVLIRGMYNSPNEAMVNFFEGHSQKEFVIQIDRRNQFNLMSCLTLLAHELVHVKQYASRQLVLAPDLRSALWEGQRYWGDVPYRARPWEREAYYLQEVLIDDYLNAVVDCI